MGIIEYNAIRERRHIVYENEPYEVLESSIKKKNRQKPANQTKIRNLISGAIKQVAFHQSDSVRVADIDKKTVTYSFQKFNRQTDTLEYWFLEGTDRSARFFLTAEQVGDAYLYLRENTQIDALTWNNDVIGIKPPIKVTLTVKDAPPNIKGNTVSGGDKKVTLETGAVVTVPMFIESGDAIIVNTETGAYVERAK
jgi:elongation factor P